MLIERTRGLSQHGNPPSDGQGRDFNSLDRLCCPSRAGSLSESGLQRSCPVLACNFTFGIKSHA